MQVTKNSIWNSTVQFPDNKEDQQTYVKVVQDVAATLPTHATSWLEKFDEAVRTQVGFHALQGAASLKDHYTTRFYLWSQKHPNWATVLKIITLGAAILVARDGRIKYESNAHLIQLVKATRAISKTIVVRKLDLQGEEEGVLTSLKTQNVVFSQVLAKLDVCTQKNEGTLRKAFSNSLRSELIDRFTYNSDSYLDDTQYANLVKIFERIECAPQIAQMQSIKKVYEKCSKWDTLSLDAKKGIIAKIKGGQGEFTYLLKERIRQVRSRLQQGSWDELQGAEFKEIVKALSLDSEYERAKRRIIEKLEDTLLMTIKRPIIVFDSVWNQIEEITQKNGKLDGEIYNSLQNYLTYSSRNFLSNPVAYTDQIQHEHILKVLERMKCVNQIKELQADKKIYDDCKNWKALSLETQKKYIWRMAADKARFAPLREARIKATTAALLWPAFRTLSAPEQKCVVEVARLFATSMYEYGPSKALNQLIEHVKTKVFPTCSLEEFETEAFRATVHALGLKEESKRAYAFQKGQYLSKEIKKLEAGQEPGWQESAVSLIRNNRFDDVHLEYQRLKGANAFTEAESKAIENAVDNVYLVKNTQHRDVLSLQAQVLYAGAHEIKRLYEKTHHIFLHAQALKWSVVPQLIKELISVYTPEVNLHHFKFLRTEGKVLPESYWEMLTSWHFTHFVKSILGYAKSVPKTAREFIEKTPKIHDDDLETRAKILSVDAYLYNNSEYESALFFLMNNSNILSNDGVGSLKNVIKSTLTHFNSKASADVIEDLASRILKSTEFTEKLVTTGNLYVVAIPKEKSEDIQYRAHPFGRPCRCHRGEDHNAIVDKLQKGILNSSTKCNAHPNPVVPQFRLYLPALKPGEGSKMVRLNALDREDARSIKNIIKLVAKRLHAA